MKYSLKAKDIIIALYIDEFLCISHYEIAKEMWNIIQVILKGITKVKMTRVNTLTREYILLRMKLEEKIYDMQKCFIHVVNHTSLGKCS